MVDLFSTPSQPNIWNKFLQSPLNNNITWVLWKGLDIDCFGCFFLSPNPKFFEYQTWTQHVFHPSLKLPLLFVTFAWSPILCLFNDYANLMLEYFKFIIYLTLRMNQTYKSNYTHTCMSSLSYEFGSRFRGVYYI